MINQYIKFNDSSIKEYIDLVENFTDDECLKFYSSSSYSFDVIFTELLNQKKIKLIDKFEDLKSLLDNKLSKVLELFDKIYCNKKTSELLHYILSPKKFLIGQKEIEFIKNYIKNNSIEIDDELFVVIANAELITLLEYCFENKFQLTNSIVLKIHTTKIIDELKLANNYNYSYN